MSEETKATYVDDGRDLDPEAYARLAELFNGGGQR
jgi:hypothetical protein